jgi:flagellum-specific peptidoglycan hydrolase FlgJ
MSDQKDFIESIAKGAQKAHKEYGVFASVTIAQAILESSWGKSGLSKKANNFFGIKATPDWDGKIIKLPTKEVVHGKTIVVMAPFRSYPDKEGSVLDHAQFLRENHRYEPAFLANNGPDFAKAIARNGYATDPKYAEKLIQLIKQHQLEDYDHDAV